MREKCTRLPYDRTAISGRDLMDIVGTGGDGAHTFNISTVTAFVVTAAGVPVAKHGNRSVSSTCGAADVLEALGARIDLTAQESARVLERTGLCFMFAPTYHASMKYAAPVRKEIGARTVFNILGPLSNPAFASRMLLGVYDESLVAPLASVLLKLGVHRALVVHGDDGLDELSLASRDVGLRGHGTARSAGIPWTRSRWAFRSAVRRRWLAAGAQANAEIAKAVLSGETGPKARHYPPERGGLPVFGRQGPGHRGWRADGRRTHRLGKGPRQAGGIHQSDE